MNIQDDWTHGIGFTAPSANRASNSVAVLSERGVETASLGYVIGNDRAARFYEKSGWRLASTVVNPADTSSGPLPVEVWRYEKRLTPPT